MPHIMLPSTTKEPVDVAEASRTNAVFFFYPATGRPGVPPPEGWDGIPGARGCTPESCSYRDLYHEFRKLSFHVFGISAQRLEDQAEFARRNRVPYPILSDSKLQLAEALGLPTFAIRSDSPLFPPTLIKRLTLVASDGKIEKVFYPVFPPDKNAAEVVRYLSTRRR